MERTCKKCGKVKPIEEFSKDNKCKNGYTYCCKKCVSIRSLKYYELNKDKCRKLHKEYCKNGYSKKYYLKNREEKLKDALDYRQSHKEQIKLSRERYNQSHKEQNKQYRDLNAEKIRKKNNLLAENMVDSYLISKLHQITGLSRNLIKNHSELIEVYRYQLKLKRLTKTNQNEKCNRPEK